MEFGAREVALEALEIFLAAPKMILATELAKIPEKILEMKLVRIPEMEPVTALGTAQSNRWVLSSQPLASFAMANLLTWLDIILPAALAARASPEEELALTVKALEQNLELAPFTDSFYGSKEMKI